MTWTRRHHGDQVRRVIQVVLEADHEVRGRVPTRLREL